ncbi:MAG: hypothetical protein QM778_05500 [Myxococcales bacterium]
MNGPGSDTPAADLAASLARTLAGLRDPSVQVGWVRTQLQELGAARAADVLTVVLARAQERGEVYSTLLLRVSLALSAENTQALKRAIAGVAEVRGQLALARFLGANLERPDFDDTESGSRLEPSQTDASKPAGKQPDFGGGRPLTLGERKSIARKRDRNLLARVLRDPHPDVIRILLDNPALVEDDVVRLCARRPVPAQVLVQVFQHPRWVLRYRVRLALALNPHTPEEVALQLLPHLGPADLREVAQSGQLSERVREACSERSDRPLH